MGLPIERQEIISAPAAVHRYLQGQPKSSCCLLLAKELQADFQDLVQVDLEQADFIVLGDIGDALTRGLLDAIFNRLMTGGQLLAVHKNRFWQTGSGLRMDIGGFVAALEYGTGRAALVMGKPSADFFRVALADLGANPSEVVMVGDDIDADIGGAQRLGIFGVLTRTGKFRQNYVDASTVRPDAIIASFRDLPALLGVE
jgi:HAD superfamily hydrolase (TIGR01458 family)